MGFTRAASNAMLTTLGGLVGYVSLHSDDPGETGANEISGGTPAYARQPVVWVPPVSGALDIDTENQPPPLFDIPGGNITVSHYGMWDAPAAGTFYGSERLSTPEFYEGPGTYTLKILDVRLI